jgi:hypothetical protein
VRHVVVLLMHYFVRRLRPTVVCEIPHGPSRAAWRAPAGGGLLGGACVASISFQNAQNL